MLRNTDNPRSCSAQGLNAAYVTGRRRGHEQHQRSKSMVVVRTTLMRAAFGPSQREPVPSFEARPENHIHMGGIRTGPSADFFTIPCISPRQ